jgi:uncharacterized protein YjbJ (UPF0337 family)
MGMSDKIKNKSKEVKGKAKEKTGRATGSERLRAEGLADQGEAGVKKAKERVKDAVKDVKAAANKKKR